MEKPTLLTLALLCLFALTTKRVAAAETQTLTAQMVPFSDPEIINPLRGYHNEGQIPVRGSAAYTRITWRSLEPEKDKYDFSAIEKVLETNRLLGRKAGFRIRALTGRGQSVPDYLISMLEKGWWTDTDADGTLETYVPDWNDNDFLDRARKLILAIGARYNGDPRLGWVDIGMYGVYGEWHVSGIGENLRVGARKATAQTKRAIIDMHVEAFPDTHLVMMTDDSTSLEYALSRTPYVGWRRDSLGDGHFDDMQIENLPLARDRWQTAPVVTEFFNPVPPRTGAVDAVLRGVDFYHITTMNTINLSPWSSYSPAEQQKLIDAGKRAGYRYILDTASFPAVVAAGTTFSISAQWLNKGVAPIYDPWNITYQLRLPDGTVAWQGASALNLQRLLPKSPLQITDTFRLPADIRSGQYELALLVTDAHPRSYLRPLALGIAGARNDGSYSLGAVTIRNESEASDTPTTSPTSLAKAPAPTTPATSVAPVVVLAAPQHSLAWEPVGLVGASSYTPSGYLTGYTWSIDMPQGETKTLYGAAPHFIPTEPGTYSIKLTVHDNMGRSNSSQVKLDVLPPVKPIPVPTLDDPTTVTEVGTTSLDSTRFIPVGESRLIDDFRAGVQGWTVSKGGGNITVEVVGEAPGGLGQSAMMTFSNINQWGYAVKDVQGSLWANEGCNALRFWVKGSTLNGSVFLNKFKVQMREFDGNGERWSYDIGDIVNGTTWQQVVIPLQPDLWYAQGGKVNDKLLTVANVAELRLYADKPVRPITIWVTGIEAIRQ